MWADWWVAGPWSSSFCQEEGALDMDAVHQDVSEERRLRVTSNFFSKMLIQVVQLWRSQISYTKYKEYL